MATRGDLKDQALRYFVLGDQHRALRLYQRLLEAAPDDGDARLKIADVLAQLGARDLAAAAYRTVAMHDLRAGHPLPAIVAARALEALGEDPSALHDALAELYGHQSNRIGRFGARLAPPAAELTLAPPSLESLPPLDTLVAEAGRLAATPPAVAYPTSLHPIPLFSELSQDGFRRVLKTLTVHRLPDSHLVIREGEIGTSFYLIAAGEVRVFRRHVIGAVHELARLHDGALFGEMALLTAAPRTASVEVVGEADLLELHKAVLAQLASELVPVAAALDHFARERLIRNLLATSPLFRPFTPQQRLDLLRSFTGHEVAPGTEVIHEGQPVSGLYVVLSGEVEVVKRQDGGAVPLATLRAGEIFGEIALVKGTAATATVRAVRQSTILFLAREYFQRLVEGIPEMRAFFEELSEERILDTRLQLDGAVADLEEDAAVLV
ncbi:MAG TPA: cyclic nucleotide-binding domain-containing protein [Polyangia bacterium]|jgi:CRP-like cAMP-binding protein